MKRKCETRVTSLRLAEAGYARRAGTGFGSSRQVPAKAGHKSRIRVGSALILTVVLTTLLALIGVMFVMVARVDKIATSAISENRELNFAVETVIAKISQELVSDVPGMPGPKSSDYYDYPDPCNTWLASLEPQVDDKGTPDDPADDTYYWRQISDVNSYLLSRFLRTGETRWLTNNIAAIVIPDHNEAPFGDLLGQRADADGDGVADSKWIQLDDITSSKGKAIYAAIRIVDNGAMVNVNTAFMFDPRDPNAYAIDGSSQMQINLAELSQRGANGPLVQAAGHLQYERCGRGTEPNDMSRYEPNVVWRYYMPKGKYTPFDISDELELRNRFLLDHQHINTRIENLWPQDAFRANTDLHTPVEHSGQELIDWSFRVQNDVPGTKHYSYAHLATTFNLDRIIDPNGDIMIDINRETDFNDLYSALIKSIGPEVPALNRPQIEARFAQLTANIIDFIDDNIEVTTFIDPCDPNRIYYGFDAQPFITEIAVILGTGRPDKRKPPISVENSSFAVELYNPFNVDIPLANFQMELVSRWRPSDIRIIRFDGRDIINANSCFVISNNPSAFGLDPRRDPNVNVKQDTGLVLFSLPDKRKPPLPSGLSPFAYDLYLKRIVDVNSPMIYVDRQPSPLGTSSLYRQYFGRDVRDWHVIYQTMVEAAPTLGRPKPNNNNNITLGLPEGHNFSFFLPNPLNPRRQFVTVGDIPRVLSIGHGIERFSTIGQQLMETPRTLEGLIRLDLQDPNHRNVFQYLTVFDPNTDGIDNDGDGFSDANEQFSPELQVPGRININTAPWYVIAQLPWVSRRTSQPNYNLAQAIVAYRDNLDLSGLGGPDYSNGRGFGINPITPPIVREEPGFASIGELNFVIGGNIPYSIQQYALDGNDLGIESAIHTGFPDLTTDGLGLGDGVPDDFEERDIIFSRISNLVTVRSDVITCYILVRIGADGPQKRVVAILDRSNVYKNNVNSPNGKVRIVALHNVPDPR